MKKIIILTLPLLLVVLLTVAAYSQEHSSNTVTTKVGSPPQGSSGPESIDATSCPIPNGNITCGSRSVPVPGCGHCGIGYESYPCNYNSLAYAMDIGAQPLDPVYMPLVNGKKIRWTFSHQTIGPDGITAIQYYGGTDEETQDQYWIQFHHTAPGSGGGEIYSGEKGAQICQSGCSTGSGPHLHIEFAKIDNSGNQSWQDAPNYFCK